MKLLQLMLTKYQDKFKGELFSILPILKDSKYEGNMEFFSKCLPYITTIYSNVMAYDLGLALLNAMPKGDLEKNHIYLLHLNLYKLIFFLRSIVTVKSLDYLAPFEEIASSLTSSLVKYLAHLPHEKNYLQKILFEMVFNLEHFAFFQSGSADINQSLIQTFQKNIEVIKNTDAFIGFVLEVALAHPLHIINEWKIEDCEQYISTIFKKVEVIGSFDETPMQSLFDNIRELIEEGSDESVQIASFTIIKIIEIIVPKQSNIRDQAITMLIDLIDNEYYSEKIPTELRDKLKAAFIRTGRIFIRAGSTPNVAYCIRLIKELINNYQFEELNFFSNIIHTPIMLDLLAMMPIPLWKKLITIDHPARDIFIYPLEIKHKFLIPHTEDTSLLEKKDLITLESTYINLKTFQLLLCGDKRFSYLPLELRKIIWSFISLILRDTPHPMILSLIENTQPSKKIPPLVDKARPEYRAIQAIMANLTRKISSTLYLMYGLLPLNMSIYRLAMTLEIMWITRFSQFPISCLRDNLDSIAQRLTEWMISADRWMTHPNREVPDENKPSFFNFIIRVKASTDVYTTYPVRLSTNNLELFFSENLNLRIERVSKKRSRSEHLRTHPMPRENPCKSPTH